MTRHASNIIAGLGIGLVVLVGVVQFLTAGPTPTPYASTSGAADGTLALYRWVGALGWRPERLEHGLAGLERVGALFVLEPRQVFSPPDASRLLQWVRGGGTLVLLSDLTGSPLAALTMTVQALPDSAGTPVPVGPVQPLLAHPPLRAIRIGVAATIASDDPRAVPVLAVGEVSDIPPAARRSVLLYERLGRGQVYAGSIPAVVTNSQIGSGENRLLTLNLLAATAKGARIGFDEYHLIPPSVGAAVPVTLRDALTTTAWGRALLYAMALLATYVVLTGRRFGRPLRPIPERGRSLAEYVVSMAGIFRRAGLRVRVLHLWQQSLRHDLTGAGRREGGSDRELVAEAAQRRNLTDEEQNEALTLLRPREALSESSLVDLCRRIDRLQRRLTRM